MEIRDLYDENKRLTGETIVKGEKVPKGRYYLTVIVWIQNFKGEFLLQQRAPQKDNKWATTGGHPVSGETSEQGILTEIKEELGLDINRNMLYLFKTIRTENDFLDMYYIKSDIKIEDIIMQEDEVQNVKWFTNKEIERLINEREFSKSHEEFYGECLAFLNSK